MSSKSEAGCSWSVEEIEEVARWQRNVLWVLVALMLSTVALFVSVSSSGVVLMVFALRIAISVFCVYFVYKFANSLRQSGILYALAMFIPLVGLLALLCANTTATSILRKNGVRVGVMGVAQEDIEKLKIQALMELPTA